MSEFRADMHCHTTCSDGSFTPEEVVKTARAARLQGLSITDHDTIDAYAEAIPHAHEHGVKLISGVEFSTFHAGSSVHVLAYAFDLENESINALCQSHKESRRKRLLTMGKKLADQGHVLDLDKILLEPGSFGRPHLAQAMVEKGIVSNIKQAFNEYLGDGKSCFVPSNTISTTDTIDIIHKANGFAIIAHPHLIKDQNVLLDILKMDFDGLEAYYARFSARQEEVWVKIGTQRKWIITGGSDFHGAMKPTIPLGSSWVEEDTFNLLHERYQQNSHA